MKRRQQSKAAMRNPRAVGEGGERQYQRRRRGHGAQIAESGRKGARRRRMEAHPEPTGGRDLARRPSGWLLGFLSSACNSGEELKREQRMESPRTPSPSPSPSRRSSSESVARRLSCPRQRCDFYAWVRLASDDQVRVQALNWRGLVA